MKNVEKIDKESVLNTISSVMKDLQKNYKVKSIALFGSYVRGENQTDSDIDLLVEFEDHADLFDLTGLADFLENKLNHSVDIVSKNGLRKELRDSVSKEAIPV